MTNNNAGITDGVTAHITRGEPEKVRRTYRILVEITCDVDPDDEYTSHDLVDAIHHGYLAGLVPHDAVMIQTSSAEDKP